MLKIAFVLVLNYVVSLQNNSNHINNTIIIREYSGQWDVYAQDFKYSVYEWPQTIYKKIVIVK